MATLKLYRNGVSTYTGGSGDHVRAKRGVVRGWTNETARRQLHWLWTVDEPMLSGHGYAVTLTIRDCPPTSDDFHRLRDAYLKRLVRMGATRVHWVIEWQRRGVPHMHAAVYFAEPLTDEDQDMLAVHWIIVATKFGTGLKGQQVDQITAIGGWLKYLAKHASRGARHYQRSGAPEGWEKTGRMWGKTGGWPEIEPIVLDDLSSPEFWRVRRALRAWARAQQSALVAKPSRDPERHAANLKTLSKMRRMPARQQRRESSYMGASEWINEAAMLRLVQHYVQENS